MANEIVIDIETKKSFEEVGGHEHLTKLGVSCAGAYFYKTNSYYAYAEDELPLLEKELAACDRIIGFNINYFDMPVLGAYMDLNRMAHVARLDLFQEVVKKLGHRLSLDSLAGATLGAKKSGNGLQALQWYKEGKMEEIKKYCLEDVRLTKELYEYGKTHRKLFYSSYFKPDKMTVQVEWGDAVPTLVKNGPQGFQGKLL
jgi:DEAD/DEAH box helicase domain-containing protein